MSNLIKKIQDKINEEISIKYPPIDNDSMIIGTAFFNNECHRNAVQYAVINKCTVWMCFIIDSEGLPVIHFINKVNGKFQDNTLGWEFEENSYHLIREIKTNEYSEIVSIFRNFRKCTVRKYVSNFRMKVSGFEYWNVC